MIPGRSCGFTEPLHILQKVCNTFRQFLYSYMKAGALCRPNFAAMEMRREDRGRRAGFRKAAERSAAEPDPTRCTEHLLAALSLLGNTGPLAPRREPTLQVEHTMPALPPPA
jgi:hypothetical protein